jgi:hypothetical protein
MSYTIDDIGAAVGRLHDEDWDEEYHDDASNTAWDSFCEAISWGDKVAILPNIGTARIVDDFGGEGSGDDFWFVFTITDEHDQVRTFKRNGWYASHDGGYYEGPTEEVHGVDKVVTVWEAIA